MHVAPVLTSKTSLHRGSKSHRTMNATLHPNLNPYLTHPIFMTLTFMTHTHAKIAVKDQLFQKTKWKPTDGHMRSVTRLAYTIRCEMLF